MSFLARTIRLSQDDPVRLGFVASLNKPGGNSTGVSLLSAELTAKRVEVARQLMPKGAPLAYLMNPPAPEAPRYLQEIEAITRKLRQELIVVKASNPEQIDGALAEVNRRRAGALIVSIDGYFISRREQIVTLAARDRVPAIYDLCTQLWADFSATARIFPPHTVRSEFMRRGYLRERSQPTCP
jgi:putative ABC transport system substrate-binding protein